MIEADGHIINAVDASITVLDEANEFAIKNWLVL
jgi:hypothetical protein